MSERLVKRPSEVRVYRFGFGEQPEIDDYGQTLTGTPTVPAVSGLTIGSPTISGTEDVLVQISGGTDNTEYHVACRCNTSGGATLEACLILLVKAC